MSKKQILEELSEYSQLKDNWDSDGAVAGEKESLLDALQFVNMVPEEMLNGAEACLHLYGKYSITWNFGEHDAPHASLEFLDNGQISMYTENHGMKAKGMMDLKFGRKRDNNGQKDITS